jgi:adenylate cyclase, class 2
LERASRARRVFLEETMSYEVEQKFPLADIAALENALAALRASISQPHSEVDLYFAHPARDFAKTDEALRIRCKGSAAYITYKGPKIDATTKTRQEIELPLAADGESTGTSAEESATAWRGLLEKLGFSPVAEVRKSRRKAFVLWQGRRIEVSLDDVEQVGTFAELELVVDAAELEPAKACIASLAAHLGLAASERRSYLELLLTQTQQGSLPRWK